MADVQLEHGHVRLANRLAEAMLAAPFTGTQLRILLALVRLTYGWKRRTARVALDQLARAAGVAYTGGFRRALEELTLAGVVIEVAPGFGGVPTAYAIQKDHEQWGQFSIAQAALTAKWGTRPDSCDEKLPAAPAPTGAEGSTVPPEVGAPTGADTLPPQGQQSCPHRGRQAGDNAPSDNELGAQKERKDSESNTTATTARSRDAAGAAPALAVVLASAINRGITERWGAQPAPIRHSAGSTLKAADDIAAAGVPGDFARDAIYTLTLKCALDRPPRSAAYFTTAVIERWEAEQELAAAAAAPAPTRLAGAPRRGRPDPRETIEAAHATALEVGRALGMRSREEVPC